MNISKIITEKYQLHYSELNIYRYCLTFPQRFGIIREDYKEGNYAE